MAGKPRVFFNKHSVLVDPLVRNRAVVLPYDHPSALVSNTKYVITSPVVKVNDDGSFETENSIYEPREEGDDS